MVATLRTRKHAEDAQHLMFPGRTVPKENSFQGYPFMELTAVIPSFALKHRAILSNIPSAQWGWETGFLVALTSWLEALRWVPESTAHVTLLELALDFEAFSGRALPSSPSAKFAAITLPLQERARVLRVALIIMRRHVEHGSLFPGKLIARANSLYPFGAGCHMGLNTRPYFAAPNAMIQQIDALQRYVEGRWICQQMNRLGGAPPPSPLPSLLTPTPRVKGKLPLTAGNERLSARGGAVRKGCFATDHYTQHSSTFRALSPWNQRKRARAVNGGLDNATPALPHLKRCVPHAEAQCARCASQRRGVRDCCSRGHHRCRKHQKTPCAICASRRIAARTCCTQGHHVSQTVPTVGNPIVSLARKARKHHVLRTPRTSTQSVSQRTRMPQQQLRKRARVLLVASDDAPANKRTRLHDSSSLPSDIHERRPQKPLVLPAPFCLPGSDPDATHQGVEQPQWERRKPPSQRTRAEAG